NEYNGIKPLTTVTSYNSAGAPTSSSIEDPSNGYSALLNTITAYNSLEDVISTQTTDPANSNAIVSSATYGYDEGTPQPTSGIPQHNAGSGARGNQTSAHVSTGSGSLDSMTTYYDTGMPVSSTAPGVFTTNYSYDSTQTFAIQTTLPTPSSGVHFVTSATYDTDSGAQTSVTGPNSGQTFVAQYDT